jgi:hypothetical protein
MASLRVGARKSSQPRLEPVDGRTGQWTKDAVDAPFVITQAAQRLLDPQPVLFGHTVSPQESNTDIGIEKS